MRLVFRRTCTWQALVVHSPCKGRANARLKALFDGHGGYEISRACAAKLFDFFGEREGLACLYLRDCFE